MKWFFAILFILVACFLAIGPIMSQVEEPKYDVLYESGDFEIRQYKPQIIAQVFVSGELKDARRQGFRLLADYIFGNNSSNTEISMTRPVVQERIPMTAPVVQEASDEKGGSYIHFVMPASYTMDTIPKPLSPNVVLVSVDSQTVAAVYFSGIATEVRLQEKTKKLFAMVQKAGYRITGMPKYAFYNPPWTLAMFRRNEVWVVVEKKRDPT